MQPELELSFWPILFLIAGGQALFFSLWFFVRRKKGSLAYVYLSLILLLFAYNLFFNFCWWTHYLYEAPHIYLTNYISYYCFGPLFFLYVDSTRDQPRFQRFRILHFLPPLLLLLLLGPILLARADTKVSIMLGEIDFPTLPTASWLWDFSDHRYFGGQMILYLIVLISIGFQGGSEKKNRSHASKQKYWYKMVVGLYAGFTVSFLLYFPLSDLEGFRNAHDFMISGIMTICIYAVGFLGFGKERSAQSSWTTGFRRVSSGTTLSASVVHSWERQLEEVMLKEELYLNNKLRIADVANRLGLTVHEVSHAVNQSMGYTFNQYVNAKRLSHAKQMLRDPKFNQMQILEIAFASGFNNKTTFNAQFKEDTGMSPRQYRRQSN